MKPLLRPRRTGRSQPPRAGHIVVLYLGMVAAWLFDFQADTSGAGLAIQAFFLSIFVVFGLLFFFADRAGQFRIPGLGPLMVTGTLYVVTAAISGLVAGQPVYAVLRNALPASIYLAIAYPSARVIAQSDPQILRRWLTRLCLGFLVTGFVIGFANSGNTFETVRFQILGGSTIPALGYIALAALFRLTVVEWAAFCFALFVTFLSVTRTNLVIIFTQALPLLRHANLVFSRRIILLSLVAIVAILIVVQFGAFGIDRWTARLFGSAQDRGIDPTAYARLSEVTYMYEAWTRSIAQFLFGNGLAAHTEYYVPIGYQVAFDYSVGFGHNQYMSILFTAGLVGGGPLMVVQLMHVWRSFVLLTRVVRQPRPSWHLLMLTAWGAVIVLGLMANNALSSSFGSRSISLWFGIGTGLLLGGQACFLPENRRILAALARQRQAEYSG